jgi:hypothetical protein
MKASKIVITTVNKFYMTNQNNMGIKQEILEVVSILVIKE